MNQRAVHPCIRIRRQAPTRGGFTLIELTLGLIITSLVLGALTAFCASMARSMSDADGSQTIFLAGTQASKRLEDIVKHARYINLVRPGSTTSSTNPHAGVLLWKNDAGQNSGVMDYEEMAWIEQNPSYPLNGSVSTPALVLYESIPTSQMTATQQFILMLLNSRSAFNSYRLTGAMAGASSFPEIFKSLDFVKPKVIARNVSAAAFNATIPLSSSQAPSLEFKLVFMMNGFTEMKYGSASLRSPGAAPR